MLSKLPNRRRHNKAEKVRNIEGRDVARNVSTVFLAASVAEPVEATVIFSGQAIRLSDRAKSLKKQNLFEVSFTSPGVFPGKPSNVSQFNKKSLILHQIKIDEISNHITNAVEHRVIGAKQTIYH